MSNYIKQSEPEFNEYANEYRSIHTDNVGRVSGTDSEYFCEYKIKEIKDHVKGDYPAWLDLGCGDGLSARFVTSYFPGTKYQGIDVSDVSIEEAKAKHIPSAEFMLYDGKRFPFPDDSFDMVFSACVFHHIRPEDRDGILDECFRVLRPGGKLVIFEHNTYNPVTRKIVRDCIFDDNAILVNEHRFRKQIKQHGFRNVLRRFTIFFPRKGLFKGLAGHEYMLRWCMFGGQYYIVAEK